MKKFFMKKTIKLTKDELKDLVMRAYYWGVYDFKNDYVSSYDFEDKEETFSMLALIAQIWNDKTK